MASLLVAQHYPVRMLGTAAVRPAKQLDNLWSAACILEAEGVRLIAGYPAGCHDRAVALVEALTVVVCYVGAVLEDGAYISALQAQSQAAQRAPWIGFAETGTDYIRWQSFGQVSFFQIQGVLRR